jgi:glc operon protein GlcG
MNRLNNHMHQLCLAAFRRAETHNVNIAVVAVDLGGHPVVVLRADHAAFPTMEAARRKAVASASLKMPTAGLAEMFAGDPMVLTALGVSGDMLVVPGGFPIIFENRCVGGLGIAGGHYSEDDAIGRAALAIAGADSSASHGEVAQ